MHSINLKHIHKTIVPADLKLGGSSPRGDRISFTNYYMEMNGLPFFGISGEFHFSRYPWRDWEDELIKIKLGGVNLIATYIFWIHHEEEQGRFDWDGSRNLRYFVELCAKHKLWVIIRVGPFDHGEVRNGGLPDWLYGRPFEVRSNDEGYLAYVRRLYREIGQQVQGQFFQDGGPIIGVQLENEYMHAAAPWEMVPKQAAQWLPGGAEGAVHLRKLREIAGEAGLVAPIYTSTGWGGAPVLEGEILPLYGGYAFCPWNVTEAHPTHAPTHEYLFQSYHDNHAKARGFDPPYPPEAYPYACCEMGGGMQVWYQYRFVVPPESVEAMAVQKIAGGCNFIGYYMYHGGSNPVGQHGYLNEHVVPKISYDFQAPLGEFGQVRESYWALRLLHQFLTDFADLLCPMATALPDGSDQIEPSDTETLRYAVRTANGAGFVFLNNYQDHVETQDHPDVQIALEMEGETLALPAFALRRGVCGILPFNLRLGSVLLKYATAQLITRLDDGEAACYFFFTPEGIDGQFCFDRATFASITVESGSLSQDEQFARVAVQPGKTCWITLTARDGQTVRLCTLTRQQALGFSKADLWGRERIVLTDADLLVGDGLIRLQQTGSADLRFSLYPDVDGGLTAAHGDLSRSQNGEFAAYEIRLPAREIALEVQRVKDDKAVLTLPPDAFSGIRDILLRIDYLGDVGYAFIDGRLINDNFCNGAPWEIGLKRFEPEVTEKGLYLYIAPLRRGKVITSDSAMAAQQEFVGAEIAEIRSIEAVPQYEVTITRRLS